MSSPCSAFCPGRSSFSSWTDQKTNSGSPVPILIAKQLHLKAKGGTRCPKRVAMLGAEGAFSLSSIVFRHGRHPPRRAGSDQDRQVGEADLPFYVLSCFRTAIGERVVRNPLINKYAIGA